MMDVFIRQDLWNNSVKTPYKTGCDLVGRVINVGIDADESIHVGDLVCSLGLSIGGNAKYAIIPSSRVFVCPEDIHPSITACLVRNYMAAYQCLHRAGGKKIKAGHRVLVLGGAGAFGQACIQLAIAAGAEMVYATGKSDRSKIIIESLGAQSLGRNPNEWLPKVQGKMDIVIDSVCSDRFRSSHRALNSSGKLVCVGSTAVLLGGSGNSVYSGIPSSVKYDMKKAAALMENTSVYDIFTYFESKRDYFRKDLLRLFHLCRQLEISPKVSYCIPLDEVANAHEDLQMGDVADGSIVCLPFGVSPDAVEVNKHQNDSDAVVIEYSDGVKMRLNVTTKAMAIQVGKVQRDGSFKVSRVKPPADRSDLLTFENRDDTDDDYAGGRRSHRSSKSERVDSEPEIDVESIDRGLNHRKNSKIKRRSSTTQLGFGLESPSSSFDDRKQKDHRRSSARQLDLDSVTSSHDGRKQRDHRRSSTRQMDLDSVASSYDGRRQRDHRRSSTRQMDLDSVASSYDGRKQRDHRRSTTRQLDLDSVASSYDGRKKRDYRRSSTRQMDLDSVASSYVSDGHTLNTLNGPESLFTDDEGKSIVTTDQSFVTEGDEASASRSQQYRPKHNSTSMRRSVSTRRSSSRRDLCNESLNHGSDFDNSPQRYSRTTQSRLPSQRTTQSNSRQPSKSNIQSR
jgi:NADPH:quinone reductase-like Zn-dependent oxidoreductase